MRIYLLVGVLCGMSAVCLAEDTIAPEATTKPDQATQAVEPMPTPDQATAPTEQAAAPELSIAEQVSQYEEQILKQANGFEMRFLFGQGEGMTPEAWQTYLKGVLDILRQIDSKERTDSEKRELIAAVFMSIMKNSNRPDIVEYYGLNFTTPPAAEEATTEAIPAA